MTATTYFIIAISVLAGFALGIFVGTLMFLIHNSTLIPRLVYSIADSLTVGDYDDNDYDEDEEEEEPLTAQISAVEQYNKKNNKHNNKKDKKDKK